MQQASGQSESSSYPVSRASSAQPSTTDKMNPPLGLTSWFHPFTYKRFHILFNSLFKVFFNFPSRYLFAIGLAVIFSLRWSLPPALGCTLKQPDSVMSRPAGKLGYRYGPSTHFGKSPIQRDLQSLANQLRPDIHVAPDLD